MTGPALAHNDGDGRRFYTFGNPPESFWSVTTIINGGVPKFLHAHYAKMAAELAFEALLERTPRTQVRTVIRTLADRGRADFLERQARGELKSLKLEKQSERELALRWIKGAADRHRDAAADRGTAVHGEAEQLVLEHAREASRLHLEHERIRPWPEYIAGYQASFVRFVDDFHPEFLAAEATVFHRPQAYAGTLDAIVRVEAQELVGAIVRRGGYVAASVEEARVWDWLTNLPATAPVVLIIDFKSGKAVYAEVALQLAPYARAEFVGASDGLTELPMTRPDAGAVLHLRPDGSYQLRLVRIDDAIFDAFLFAREVFRFREETARTVLLQDLTPPALPALAEEVA